MRVLVVEDSAPTRELIAEALGEAGHRVETAARAATGRKLALTETFDVLLLDVMLPDGDGIALCRELRGEGVTTPILLLTARGDVEDRVQGLDAGADDYLRKPFALAELKARLRALARRAGAAAPSRLEHGDTRVDFAARRIACGGRDVPLTAREWQVLEVLAAHPGRVVSRDALLEGAWGEVSARASESLDVILSRLRRKLERGGSAYAVRTVRGEGYALEPLT